MKLKTLTLVATATAALMSAGAAQAQALVTFSSGYAYSVSGDGKTVAYNSGSNLISLYDVATGVSTATGGASPSTSGVSGKLIFTTNGQYLAGAVNNATVGGFTSSVYDRSSNSWSTVGSFGVAESGTASTTWDMSKDGRYVAGFALKPVIGNNGNTVNTYHAFVADRQTGSFTDVSDDPTANVESRINAVSNDGSVLIGYNTNSRYGSIWKRQGDGSYVRTQLHLDGSSANLNEAAVLSGNGLWAAGNSTSSTNPYLVNVTTGSVTSFTKMAGTLVDSVADISEDGKTILGTGTTSTPGLAANIGFIWTAAGGTVSFDSYLASFGIDLANQYNFVSPLSMSDDGTVFTGIARDNVTGRAIGFAVTVPEPSSYALMAAGLGVLGLLARRRRAA